MTQQSCKRHDVAGVDLLLVQCSAHLSLRAEDVGWFQVRNAARVSTALREDIEI